MRIEDTKAGILYEGFRAGRKVAKATDGATLQEAANNPYYSNIMWIEVPGQTLPQGVEKAAAKEAVKRRVSKTKADATEIHGDGPPHGPDQRGAGGEAE